MAPLTIGILAVLGMLGLAAAVMVPAYLRQRIPWKTSPAGFLYSSLAEDFSVARLDFAVLHAFLYLREHADFSAATLDAAERSLRILVQKEAVWVSPLHGGLVAGVTSGTTIAVGYNLAAVCHELAHACEFIEGGREQQDDSHASWRRRGIQRAIDEFAVLMG